MALAAGRVMILVVGMAGMETGDCGTWPRTSLALTTESNCTICVWRARHPYKEVSGLQYCMQHGKFEHWASNHWIGCALAVRSGRLSSRTSNAAI